MWLFYDFIFLLIALVYFPIYLIKRKFHRGFSSRLGILPEGLYLNRPIWIHAVSVGEAASVRGLVEGLRKAYPEKNFVISTVTTTGNKIAQGFAKESDFITYLPLDLSYIVRSTLERINPSVFIIAETEIWPNLIQCLYRKNIPIVTVNGRISDASFKGYLSIRFLLKPVLEKINLFCMQTERDANRLMRLGVKKDKIQVTGNMKFDIGGYADKINSKPDYRLKLGLDLKDKLFVAGSTHPGEEEIILSVYKELQKDFQDLKLLIGPRHPQRSRDLVKVVSRFGFRSTFISELPACITCIPNPVFILDKVGQLIYFYAIADIVFVGGSLIKKGGHNILEPASLNKPILFGPYMFNFRDISDLFLSNKAAIMVHNQEDLKRSITDLLNNPRQADELGLRAKALILHNEGATERNVEQLREFIVPE